LWNFVAIWPTATRSRCGKEAKGKDKLWFEEHLATGNDEEPYDSMLVIEAFVPFAVYLYYLR
jgi:hypothetical protein